MLYTVAQQKGGVGKTTTTANIAALLAYRGRRVLAVDTDPQFALTRQLGLQINDLPVTLVDVLTGRAGAADATVSGCHGFDLLPAHRDLAGVETALVGQAGGEHFLRDALEPISGDYDDIVIDTPPNLGKLTVNALVVAETVIAPVSAEDEGSAQGLAELRGTFSRGLATLRGGDTPQLIVLLTRWQPSRLMARTIQHALARSDFDIRGRIPARAAVQQAAAWRTPLALAEPDSPPALAYWDFVNALPSDRAR
jgi:chromosome partitioning protein